MFCPKCGAELADDTKFCSSCGTFLEPQQTEPLDMNNSTPQESAQPVIPPPQIFTPYQDAPRPEPAKPKKKGVFLKIVAVLLIAVIFISGVAVLGYFTFLPAKYTLWVAEYLTIQKSYSQLDKAMTRSEKQYDAFYKDSVRSENEISVSVDPSIFATSGLDSQTIALIEQYVKNMSIKIDAEMDLPNKQQALDMALNYQKNPVLSFSAYFDNKKFGFMLPELTDKTITGELKDVNRLAELYPESVDPYELQSIANLDPWASVGVRNEIDIKHSDIKKLMTTYTMAFVNSFDSEDMSIKRGQKTEVLGKEISCQEVTIKLDQKAQRKVVTTLLDTMKDDETLYNVVFGNMIKIYDMLLEQNPEMADMMPAMDLKENLSRSNFRQMVMLLKRSIKEDAFPEEVIVKAYIKGTDVVKHVITIPYMQYESVITYENVMEGESYNKKLTFEIEADDGKITAVANVDKDYDKASDTQDFLVEFDVDINIPDSKGNINVTVNSTEELEGKGKIKRDMDLDFSFDINDTYSGPSSGKLGLTLDGEETRDNKGRYTGGDYTANLEMNIPQALPQPIKMGVAYTNTTQYGVKVNIPKPDKTIDLGKATREELDAYMAEIYEKLSTLQMMFGNM